MKDCDAVLHLATKMPSFARFRSREAWENNDSIRRDGTRNLVDAALELEVKTLVYPSVWSGEVPASSYEGTVRVAPWPEGATLGPNQIRCESDPEHPSSPRRVWQSGRIAHLDFVCHWRTAQTHRDADRNLRPNFD